MALTIYNDYLRNLLKNLECILALDTAADYLGISNGGYRPWANIFVKEHTGIQGIREIIVDDFENLEFEDIHGLACTTVNQTIIDLLRNHADDQIITECLANYYDEHHESFDGLRIPANLQVEFHKYCQWAKEYYED